MSFNYEEKKAKIPDFDHLFKTGKKAPILRQMYRSNRWGFLLSILLYVIKDSPVYVIPICTAQIIDIAAKVIAGTGPADYFTPILIYSLVIVAFLLQNILFHTLYARLTDNMLRNASAGLREAVVRKLQHLSITFHNEMESGAVESKFLRDIDNTENYLNTVVKSLIPSAITASIAIGIAIYTSPLISLFFLVVIPLNVFVSWLFRKKIRKNSFEYRLSVENLSRKFSSMMEMIPVTKAHGLEENEISAMDKEVKDVRSKGLGVDYANALFGSAIWVLGNLLGFSCVIFCVFLAIKGQIGIGDVVLYQSLFSNINNNIGNIINQLPNLAAGRESLNSLSEIMSSEEIEDDQNKIHLETLKGDVELSHVSFLYKDSSKDAISDFSLKVRSGQCIALVGPSGSGKTTIVNLIIGLLKPTEGKVLIDETNLNDLSLKDYRHHLSVVPQNPVLFKGTVRENITYGLEKYSEDDLAHALKIANAEDFVSKMPHGLDTVIEENGANLSGGQKQRITIARAIIRDPRIIIFDEATSALDTISEFQVQTAIASSIQGRTTFIVAHRISTIKNADLIVFLENGTIQEEGAYDELLAKKGKFYEMQRLVDETPVAASDFLIEKPLSH
jgi:ATP-binding cassette subfamily B protein